MNYYNEHDRYAAAWLRELIADGQIPKGEVDERSVVDVQPTDLTGFMQCHFFAGIGGWPYALRLAGWPNERPAWTGSCPCQPFSSAGKQQGLADERHLWPAWYRLIRECRPPVVFGEQVEAAVRHGWLDGVFGDLEGEGYACGAAVLGAHSVGAPHIRQRLFWVAESCSPTSQRNTRSVFRAQAPVSRQNRAGYGDCVVGFGNGSADGGLGESDSTRSLKGQYTSTAPRYRGAIDPTGCTCGMDFSKSEQAGRTGQPRQDGAWADFDLIPCADGKVRRVESGTFPLVARLSETVVPSGDPSLSYVQATAEGRQMRLRGYGNAIVPQVAAEFIAAYIEALPL